MKCANEPCPNEVAWVRCTQFAGDHPFCDECARKESDFIVDKGGQSYWCTAEKYLST